jgi:predicted ABC-type transport system involved in lysophospholipase L1 biosynthesis ATPase subunit
MSRPLLEIRGLVKPYSALRPLRIRELVVSAGEIVSLAGLDGPAAEMLVHLATGAALPEEGDVCLFGASTRSIPDARAWLESLDGLGLVSARAVLIDALSVLQNVALPLTLDVDPLDSVGRARAEALAGEAGLDRAAWERPAGEVDPETRVRIHLARALASSPSLLVAEHPSSDVPRTAVALLARDLVRVARARRAALLALTADAAFEGALGGRRLVLRPATGEVEPVGGLIDRLARALGDRARSTKEMKSPAKEKHEDTS